MPQNWFPVRKTAEPIVSLGYVKSVLKRRSIRNFIAHPLPVDGILKLLEFICLAAGRNADEGEAYAGCMTPGFLALNIEGFDPGFYLLNRQKKIYGLATDGLSGEKTARV